MNDEQAKELLERIQILENQVRLLQSKNTFRSPGKRQSTPQPSKQKVVIRT